MKISYYVMSVLVSALAGGVCHKLGFPDLYAGIVIGVVFVSLVDFFKKVLV